MHRWFPLAGRAPPAPAPAFTGKAGSNEVEADACRGTFFPTVRDLPGG